MKTMFGGRVGGAADPGVDDIRISPTAARTVATPANPLVWPHSDLIAISSFHTRTPREPDDPKRTRFTTLVTIECAS
jgi:hypothetical protein